MIGSARAPRDVGGGRLGACVQRRGRGRLGAGLATTFRRRLLLQRELYRRFGTRLRVTDSMTHLSVDVVVTDRGPFIDGRMLDLSFAAAAELHMIERGLIDVTVAVQ